MAAKVLANKLKLFLPHIVTKSRLAFIKGRDIADNIALAQELSGELNSRLHGNAFCTKFDLRKAFDTINKSYIILRLEHLGFPDIFIDWIKASILDIPFSIICNGSTIGCFHSTNGLRQGCPLSPFLFTIFMDVLSELLDNEIVENKFTPLRIGSSFISHLLFADDILIFG